jgi:hypothetical protein
MGASGRIARPPTEYCVRAAVRQAVLSGLQLGERVVQAPERSISLAGTRFGFSQGRFETAKHQQHVPTAGL